MKRRPIENTEEGEPGTSHAPPSFRRFAPGGVMIPLPLLNSFDLVNFIADKMITEPKDIDGLFDGLPDTKKEAIQKRDGQ